MGRKNVVEVLLDKADNVEELINIKDGQDRTGFMLASQFGKIDIVELLSTKYDTVV